MASFPTNPEVCRTTVHKDGKTARRGPDLDSGNVTGISPAVEGQWIKKVPRGREEANLLDTKPNGILGGGCVSRCNAVRILSIELSFGESLAAGRRVLGADEHVAGIAGC